MTPDRFLMGQSLTDCLTLRKMVLERARDPLITKEEFEQWLESYCITPNPKKSKITNFYLLDQRLSLIEGPAYKLALGKVLPVEIYHQIGSFIPVYERDYRLGIPPYKEDLWIWLQRKLGIRFQPELTKYVNNVFLTLQPQLAKTKQVILNSLQITEWKENFNPQNFLLAWKYHTILRNMYRLIPYLETFFKGFNLTTVKKFRDENIENIRTYAIINNIKGDIFDQWITKESELTLYYTIMYQIYLLIFKTDIELSILLLENTKWLHITLLKHNYLLAKYLVNMIQIACILPLDEFKKWLRNLYFSF